MQDNQIFLFFAKYIEAELGIVYAEHNYFQLQNRLEEIAKLLGIPDIQALYEAAQKGISGPFKQLLLDISTNNETSFFRDEKVFKAIETLIIQSVKEKTFNTLRLHLWSAASSTGQEALTLAIIINELKEKGIIDSSYSIVGTDISERALNKAITAEYSQLEVQRGLPTLLLLKYFKKDDRDRWTASVELTRNLQFKKLNLRDSLVPMQDGYHFILCRNVLIYQGVEGKIDIIKRISACLAPGGFFIMGAGESLLGLSNDFDQVMIEGAVLYRKKAA